MINTVCLTTKICSFSLCVYCILYKILYFHRKNKYYSIRLYFISFRSYLLVSITIKYFCFYCFYIYKILIEVFHSSFHYLPIHQNMILGATIFFFIDWLRLIVLVNLKVIELWNDIENYKILNWRTDDIDFLSKFAIRYIF